MEAGYWLVVRRSNRLPDGTGWPHIHVSKALHDDARSAPRTAWLCSTAGNLAICPHGDGSCRRRDGAVTQNITRGAVRWSGRRPTAGRAVLTELSRRSNGLRVVGVNVAKLSVSLTYGVVLWGGDNKKEAIETALIKQLRDHRGGAQAQAPRWTVTQVGSDIAVRFHYVAHDDDPRDWSAANRLRELGSTLERHAKGLAEQWRTYSHLGLRDVADALQTSPQAEVYVPLLAVDHDGERNDLWARLVVEASIRETYAFWADQDQRIGAIQVRADPTGLRITAPSPEAAIDAGIAYLTARRRKTNPRASIPVMPVWAWASAAIALLSFGLAWTPLTWATLAVLTALSAATVVIAIASAPRFLAKRSVTAWGTAPILTVVTFACIYGAVSLLDQRAITIYGAPPGHLREPLLLSLSLLTTGGFLDLHVHQWVRSIAYLEMLLVASLAGGAAVVAARRVSQRVNGIVDDLQRDRELRG